MTSTPKLKQQIDLDNVTAKLAAARDVLADVETQLSLARGTRETAVVPVRAPGAPLVSKIADLLRADPMDTLELTSKLGAPAARIRAALAALRDDKLVHNVGSDVEPKWVHVLGDSGTAAELRAWVLRLISIRPFAHRELVVVTGARENRISGVLADLREDVRTRVVNLGDGSRARWFVLPPDLKIATLRRS